jgi:GyrI-like small molecule binding domain
MLFTGELYHDLGGAYFRKRDPERATRRLVTQRLKPGGGVHPVIVPAAELATIMHLGTHTEIDRSYGALATYVAEHALAIPEPLREYYLTDLASTPDQAEWRTQIG